MSEVKRPLEGVKVLELATFIAAPCCARFLADLGAEVIKVEAPAGLGGVRDPFDAGLILVIQHGAVVHGGELLRQRVEGVGTLRRVGAVLAGLGGHVIGHDVQTHLVDDGVQGRGIRQDTADDDGQLLRRGGLPLQLGNESLHQLGVLLLGHEEGALEDVAALGTKFCDPEEFDYVMIKKACEAAGIPVTVVEIDRQMVQFEQARTNIETFRDMLTM